MNSEGVLQIPACKNFVVYLRFHQDENLLRFSRQRSLNDVLTCTERSRGKILLSPVVVVPFRCRCLWSLLLYFQISSIELKFRWPQFQTLIVGRSSGECLGILRNQITNLPVLGNERNNFTRQPKHLHKLIKISRPEVTNEQFLHTTCISVHFK